jgi:putative methionine-R-sulfoxide reductase with GAF domain
MQLLEEVQHDFGEGPCLAAFAEDRVVAVQDLRTEPGSTARMMVEVPALPV